jgi:gliding motility-associated-like protein
MYGWSPTGDSTPDIYNIGVGTYSVIVTDDNGCVVSGRLDLIGPPALKMFEGISPDNADGLNDYFHVKGLEVYPSNHLTIYNRWGNVVYEQENYDNNDPDRRWYGQNEGGENLPAGTYFVVLEVNGYSDSPLTGYVDLRRDK